MSSLFSKLFRSLFSPSVKKRMLIIGLDNSGKSTLIKRIKPGKVKKGDIVPTVGFSVDEFSKNGITFTTFDMSGHSKYRSLWEHYYPECDGIIFVIDSSDTVRFCVVKDELVTLLQHPGLRDRHVPILFLANKMDIPHVPTSAEISKQLSLDLITSSPWSIQSSNAVSGTGLEEGLKWLVDAMKRPPQSSS